MITERETERGGGSLTHSHSRQGFGFWEKEGFVHPKAVIQIAPRLPFHTPLALPAGELMRSLRFS